LQGPLFNSLLLKINYLSIKNTGATLVQLPRLHHYLSYFPFA